MAAGIYSAMPKQRKPPVNLFTGGRLCPRTGGYLLFTLIVLGLIVGAFIFLRHRPSNVASLDELDGLLSAGQPTVVEFYSNF